MPSKARFSSGGPPVIGRSRDSPPSGPIYLAFPITSNGSSFARHILPVREYNSSRAFGTGVLAQSLHPVPLEVRHPLRGRHSAATDVPDTRTFAGATIREGKSSYVLTALP